MKKTAKQAAFYLLTRREYFSKELTLKLTSKGFSSKDIEETIHTCQRLGMIDDERAAQKFIEKWRSKGKGPHLIRAMLKAKGINPETINSFFQGRDAQKEIQAAVEKKTKYKKEPPDKLFRFLLRRGFPAEEIISFLSKNHCN